MRGNQNKLLVLRERLHGRFPGYVSSLADERTYVKERVYDGITDHMNRLRVDALGE